jgi:hypothetical protein
MFAITVTTSVGNGANTLFWSDCWLLGESIADLAPDVYKRIPALLRNSRTVAEALCGNNWVTDIRATLSWRGLMEYLWATLSDFHLNDLEDTHLWRFENSGTFFAKSPYKAFFVGAIKFEPWKCLWKSWAPNKCNTFIWLAIHNRCWISDRLQRRGLPHLDHCPLCDQEEENIQHILTSCVFAREFWFNILQPLNIANLVPTQRSTSFVDWWRKSWKMLHKILGRVLIHWSFLAHGSSGNILKGLLQGSGCCPGFQG